MVTCERVDNETLLVARPNRSASWRLNRLIIAAVASCWLLIAGCFLVRGLWPIIPFAGLEILGLALALYWVSWKLQQRHVLRFGDARLVLQKGAYRPRVSWSFPRETVSLSIEVQPHPWDPPKIFLCSRDEMIAVGNFLNKDDSSALLQLLREQGLRVRNYSEPSRLDL